RSSVAPSTPGRPRGRRISSGGVGRAPKTRSAHSGGYVSRSLAFQAECCYLRGKSSTGAEGGTRTPTGCPTRPSNVRVCQFRHFGALRGRSISLSPAADNSPDALAEPRVERVANSLAQEVVGEHRDEDRKAGIDRQPPADLDRVLAFVQDVAPRR